MELSSKHTSFSQVDTEATDLCSGNITDKLAIDTECTDKSRECDSAYRETCGKKARVVTKTMPGTSGSCKDLSVPDMKESAVAAAAQDAS